MESLLVYAFLGLLLGGALLYLIITPTVALLDGGIQFWARCEAGWKELKSGFKHPSR